MNRIEPTDLRLGSLGPNRSANRNIWSWIDRLWSVDPWLNLRIEGFDSGQGTDHLTDHSSPTPQPIALIVFSIGVIYYPSVNVVPRYSDLISWIDSV